ncbi:hypothetical protein BCPG3_182 [Bacillus phage BCPG3]|uniref:Uncharacterized protein n=2 Tax=Wphvirus TaxID=1922327 RepID=W5QUD9_9CAUD|nr:hypothetical protein BPS10C_204 [Bacillus phage BPS10C]YP_009282098.1 hypothetical protein SALINJAH_144 [Bacillus phage SalinJah]QQO38803.1 hypothetical protein BCPG1_072 [Bacillus phage BCPG1]QSJ04499.1 hypothetical protein BCPG3_182 [Bacillus phage BCPG3]QSJ04708.1 hypothetical protein BCP18_176 [Bacillus phage BCP18]AGI12201.1 hypothetical protein BPS10C_204 [Bacillus phage BPS10C]ANH50611.1 hypothetical protein SALINJAH_144 [Bacillus phage SalinJah]
MLRSLGSQHVRIVVKNSEGDARVGTYTLENLLHTTEEELIEELTACECEPVGESYHVECNCEDKWDDVTLHVEN